MTLKEKNKRKNSGKRRASIVIIEALIVIVALFAAGRYIFGTDEYADRPPASTVSAETYYDLADEYFDDGEYEEAIEEYTRAIEAGYEPVSYAYYDRGLAHLRLSNNEDAAADFTLSIENDPDCLYDCHYDYNNRGVAYDRADEDEKALADYTASVQLVPDYVLAHRNRAELYHDMGRTNEWLEDWNTVLILRQGDIVQRGLTASGGSRSASISNADAQVHFSFEGNAGQVVSFAITQADFDAVLMLRNYEGEPMTFSDDQNSENKKPSIRNFTLPATGSYTAVVAGYNDEQTGDFTLSMTVNR